MTGVGENISRGAVFNQRTIRHDHNTRADRTHHRQVMADKECGDTRLTRNLGHGRQNPDPDRGIKGGYRFIQHDQARGSDQRPGKGDALALAA